MRVIYWPRDEYDCTEESRRISHPSMEHYHCKSDAEVIRVMTEHAAIAYCGAPNVDAWTTGQCIRVGSCAWHDNRRYRCVTGPGGLVRDVVP